jgi:hypothetical protein
MRYAGTVSPASQSMGIDVHLNSVSRSDSNCYQQSMLVDVIKLAEVPKRVVPSLVRLQLHDDSHRLIACSVYFAANRGFIILGFGEGRLENRERRIFDSGLVAVRENGLPCEMIKSGSEIVSNVADNNAETDGRFLKKSKLEDTISSFRIIVCDNSIMVTPKVGATLDVEIADVLFGPFDLGSY